MRTPNLILLGLLGSGSAFLVPSIVNRHWQPEIQQQGIVLYAEDRRFENNYCRRSFLSLVPFLIVLFNGDDANAKDELFRPNPLTNPILEQVRIWEQAEADNLKYGGELEMGDAGNKGKASDYPSLLVPILKIEQDLAELKTLVNEGTPAAWKKGLHILQTERYDKTNFKKTFNKYGDNIYYSDPDRANAYLAGGATPKTEQSIAYLLRNDILTNMENLRAELEYLLKSGDSETEDLYLYSNAVNSAMAKYLAIVPPNELDEARRLLSSS
eukprot:scaffold4887_cov118-Cylindrotheca_fusiformis.AAC.8